MPTRPTRRSRPSDVTKRLRMTRDEADELAALAAARRTTESDVLRQGVAVLRAQTKRAAAFAALVRQAQQVPGERAPFGLR